MNRSTDKNRGRLLFAGISSRNAQKSRAISVPSTYSFVNKLVIEQPFHADPISGRRPFRVLTWCEKHGATLIDFDCPFCQVEAVERMNDALRLMGYQEAA